MGPGAWVQAPSCLQLQVIGRFDDNKKGLLVYSGNRRKPQGIFSRQEGKTLLLRYSPFQSIDGTHL